jgi:succinate dehydrogenase/fumarate reductase iron-sulfur protein
MTIEIQRGRKGSMPVFKSYEIELPMSTPLVELFEYIRTKIDPDFLYRHSCHHGSCGTCGVRANGKEVLGCLSTLAVCLSEVKEGEVVKIEALRGFVWEGDLLIDPSGIVQKQPKDFTYLRDSEYRAGKVQKDYEGREVRFEDCIECGLCVSACPVSQSFSGPAALAAYNRTRLKKNLDDTTALKEAKELFGLDECQKVFACSKACPSHVYPGKQLADLRKLAPKQ